MLRTLGLSSLFVLSVFVSLAQRIDVQNVRRVAGDSTKYTKRSNHYLGVQVNQLINQLLNFSGSGTAVENPYLLIYSVNSVRSGVGLNVGLGYSIQSTSGNTDPNTTRETDINSFNLRLGVEKKSFIAKKWIVSWGFDVVFQDEVNNTKVSSNFQFNSNTTDSESSTSSIGFGPRGALNFMITDRLLIGTEATYYYKSIKVAQETTNTSTFTSIDPFTGVPTTTTNSSTTKSEEKNKDFTFQVPLAVFLILKF